MNKSESIKELASALCKAQAEIRGAVKDSDNPFFKSKYADLESVWQAIREPLSDNGLSVAQPTGFSAEGKPVVETILMHVSGEWISGEFLISSKDQSAQAVGSGTSYARRYALAAMLGVYQTDDDGNDASGKNCEQEHPKKDQQQMTVVDPLIPDGTFPPKVHPRLQERLKDMAPHDPAIQAIGKTKVTFGKFKDRAIASIKIDEGSDYVRFLQNSALREGKEIKGQVKDFITNWALWVKG